jgi:hypothetical protein
MQQYIARQIERVRSTPDDGLLSRLANLDTEGRRLDIRELQSLTLQILVAGNETMTTTQALGMKTLIERSELADQIHRNPECARPFVEETSGVTAPLQTPFRRALIDVQIRAVGRIVVHPMHAGARGAPSESRPAAGSGTGTPVAVRRVRAGCRYTGGRQRYFNDGLLEQLRAHRPDLCPAHAQFAFDVDIHRSIFAIDGIECRQDVRGVRTP